MATRSPFSLTSSKRESLTCSLCQKVFTLPKLLPCSHTFCQRCLEDALGSGRNLSRTLSCPSCREHIQIPNGGVAALPNNLYIDEEELERARDQEVCSPKLCRRLKVMLCTECDRLICMDCKIEAHLHHKSQSLEEVKKATGEIWLKDQRRLQRKKENIERNLAKCKRESEEFQSKKATVEDQIRSHHATVMAAADDCLTEALNSLHKSCQESEATLLRQIQSGQSEVEGLDTVQRKMEDAIHHGDACALITTAKEVTTEVRERVNRMETPQSQNISRPVHTAHITQEEVDELFYNMGRFIGKAKQVTYNYSNDHLEIKEEVQCGERPDSVVLCICPLEKYVYVSFDSSYQETEPWVKVFSVDKRCVRNSTMRGAYSFARTASPHHFASLLPADPVHRYTAAKHAASSARYALKTEQVVNEGTVVTMDEEVEDWTVAFTVSCSQQRAFDINRSTEVMAVVEEDEAGGGGFRQVMLYPFGSEEARDRYVSPLSPFQPADVCFYMLRQEEVLLIADEMNDAIHVAEVKDGLSAFSRFLAPGCPLLVRPTALNTDAQGRLWVGCRGGRLLTVREITPPDNAAAVPTDALPASASSSASACPRD